MGWIGMGCGIRQEPSKQPILGMRIKNNRQKQVQDGWMEGMIYHKANFLRGENNK